MAGEKPQTLRYVITTKSISGGPQYMQYAADRCRAIRVCAAAGRKAALAFSFSLEVDPVSYVLHGSWTSTAEALIGRPATPASSVAWCGARRGALRLARIARTGSHLSGAVDLLQFAGRPAHRVRALHAFDRLRIHVDDDVLADRLCRRAAGRPGIAGEAAALRCSAVWQHHRIYLPHLMVLPDLRRAHRKTLLRDEPFVIDLLRAKPAQEVLRGLLVL